MIDAWIAHLAALAHDAGLSSAAEARRSDRTLTSVPLMREIDRYNEIDCRVMAEVLDFLRREH